MAADVQLLIDEEESRARARRAQADNARIEKERLEIRQMLQKEKEERDRHDLLAAKVRFPFTNCDIFVCTEPEQR
jgi:hypothetical protein